ncbi:MAG: PAS domain-containing protein, partial [Candidatus Latescibacteria bacterium]|nr:PAS domain-containing protein [Candidatus Latescibacterota bacterium]
MTWQYNPYIWPLAISAIVAWAVAIYMWPRRKSAPGGFPVFILLICAGFWSASYAMEFASADLQGKFFWNKIVYLGIAPVCPLWFLFALNYSGWSPRNRTTYLLLAIEPVLVQIAVWTNFSHQNFWTHIELVYQDNTPVLMHKYGTLFWIHAAFAYLLLIVSTVVLIQLLIRTSHLYKRQVIAIISGLFVPWAGNVIYLSGSSPFGNLDLAPLSFTLASCILVWGLFHSKLFEAIPIARETLIANMPNVVLVTDLHNRLVFANPAAQDLFGKSVTRKLGQSVSEILPKIWQTLEHLKEHTHTEIELQKEDAVQHYELYFTLLHNRQKHLSGHLIVLQDIGKQKETEERLTELETAAEQANRAKSIFLANMSHEMRTPLNAILGYAQITADADNLQERHQRAILAIEKSGGHLLQLIDDILHLSKIDSGQAEVNLVGFDLHKLLQEIGRMFKSRCEQQSLNWRMDIALDTKHVTGDANKLRQVLINLLDNAVKFTSKGEV